MSNENRTRILSKLARTDDDKVLPILNNELVRISEILKKSLDYFEIDDALEEIKVFAFRLSSDAFECLSEAIERIENDSAEIDRRLKDAEYFSVGELQEKIVELISLLNYFETERVAKLLLKYSSSTNRNIKSSSITALDNISKINLEMFETIGVEPQVKLLNEISKLNREDVLARSNAVLKVLENFVDSNMESHNWGYEEVTVKFATVPSRTEVIELRESAINLLKELFYFSDSFNWRRRILRVLNGAMYIYTRGGLEEASLKMYSENALCVLSFYDEILDELPLELVQQIEHDSYWEYYHAPEKAVETKALEIEDHIKRLEEYQIFRDLVGYQGVFGDWTESKAGESKHVYISAEKSEEIVNRRLATVTTENLASWFIKVVDYSHVKSNDLATFPRLYAFVRGLCGKFPNEMFLLLINNQEKCKYVLIPLLTGLWETSERDNVKTQLREWLFQERNIYAIAKLFLNTSSIDAEIIELTSSKATEAKDIQAIAILYEVVCNNVEELGETLVNELFLRLTVSLDNSDDIEMIATNFYLPTWRTLVESLREENVELLLSKLILVTDIDYHCERILVLVGKRYLEKLFNLFRDRIEFEDSKESNTPYSAIPFRLDKLLPILSGDVDFAVDTVRGWYHGDFTRFTYRGARLLAVLFPLIEGEFEDKLVELAKSKAREDVEFVVAVMRSYYGETFNLRIFFEIVKNLKENDPLLDELKASLESTGIVRGKHGISKSLLSKIEKLESWKNDSNPKVREFAEKYIGELSDSAKKREQSEIDDDEQRRYKYGVESSKE